METRPGDLILVKSPGLVWELGRRLGGNAYDHVAIVGSEGRTVNIDKPSARLLRVERLLRPQLRPKVLRPRFASDEERAAFVAEMERLVTAPYDVRRTLGLVARLVTRRLVRVSWPLPRLGWDREKWICTDAVLLGLERHARGFDAIRELPLDWVRLAAGTTNDLLEISRRRPDLLATVS